MPTFLNEEELMDESTRDSPVDTLVRRCLWVRSHTLLTSIFMNVCLYVCVRARPCVRAYVFLCRG